MRKGKGEKDGRGGRYTRWIFMISMLIIHKMMVMLEFGILVLGVSRCLHFKVYKVEHSRRKRSWMKSSTW